MSDHELLLAISNMMDEKLKENLKPIEIRLDKLEDRMCALENRVGALEDEMKNLGNRVGVLENRVGALENRVGALEDEVKNLGNRVGVLEDETKALKNTVGGLDSNIEMLMEKMLKVEVKLDHNISSRMKNIEDCYLAAFERYQNSTDTYEDMQEDHQLLKKVVAKHSQRLQALERAVGAN